MKGILNAGPAIEPFCLMYRSVHGYEWLKVAGLGCSWSTNIGRKILEAARQ
jgi:hypothetical protein